MYKDIAAYTQKKLAHKSWYTREFNDCVKVALPQMQRCLDELGYVGCGNMLYSGHTPGVLPVLYFGVLPSCAASLFTSLYTEQLEQWFTHFPKENFLVMHMDDWTNNTDAAMARIGEHFGVKPKVSTVTLSNVNHNARLEATPIPTTSIAKLSEFYGARDGWKHLLWQAPKKANGSRKLALL